MKVICAWCGRGIIDKEDKHAEEACQQGICGECVAKLEARRVDNNPAFQQSHILVRYIPNLITLD